MHRIPDGFYDLLPQEAEVFYFLQQKLFSAFQSFGYKPIIPPSVEFIKTYTECGEKEEQTFNFIDQYEGTTACFRFDFTPQIVRIVSANLEYFSYLPIRLYYAGSVLRNPEGLKGVPREIHHMGVELIGCEGIEAEAELLIMILKTINELSTIDLKLFLNDTSIIKKILFQLGISENKLLLESLIKRDVSTIKKDIAQLGLPENIKAFIKDLPLLCGDVTIINDVKRQYKIDFINTNLDRLIKLSKFVKSISNKKIFFDLGEIRGFEYHTGIVFDGYLKDLHGREQEVLTGGRYDNLFEKYTKKKLPAIGFAIDIEKLSSCFLPPKDKNVAIITKSSFSEKAFKVLEKLQKENFNVSLIIDLDQDIVNLKNKFDYIFILRDNKKLVSL